MKKFIWIGLIFLIIIGVGLYSNFSGILGKNIFKPDNTMMTQIKNKGKLVVGVDATYFPMEFLDSQNNVVGFDADLAKEIAKEFGVPVEFKTVVFDDIFNQLAQGKFDMVISSVTINLERSKTMAFSKPYFNAGQVVVVLKSNSEINNLLSLKGKKIGVQSGTTSETNAKTLTEANQVLGYADYNVAMADLVTGKIEAMIMDYPAAVGIVKNNSNLKLVGKPFTQEFYGVVVAKGKEDLLIPVNRVIEQLVSSGEMTKMEAKWLD